MPSYRYALPWAGGLSLLTMLSVTLKLIPWSSGLITAIAGLGSASLVANWLNRKLGGHTGDTYGAVVEWVEVAVLVSLACAS